LFRNILGAIKSTDVLSVDSELLYWCLKSEIDVIDSLFQVEGLDLCKPVYYVPSYKTPYTREKHAAITLRQDTTDHQRIVTKLLEETMVILRKSREVDVKWVDHALIPETMVTALILTHVPYDLLSYSKFRKLDLLESHTGKLKPRGLWYTKYYQLPGENMATLPFTRKFLLLFGDKVMFSPVDIRFRRLILDISKKQKWNPMTTDAKINYDLNHGITERYLYEMYLKI